MLEWLLSMWLLSVSPQFFGESLVAEQNVQVQAASAEETVQRQPEKIPKQWVLRDKSVLQAAQQSLLMQPELADNPVYVFEKINFFDGDRPRIELAVLNPKQPEHLIFFTFEQNKWTTSPAEDVSHIKNLSRHLFALSDVEFAQAADIATTWAQKAREVNAPIDEPYYVAYVFLPKSKKQFWHTATIETVGKQFYLSCHQDGRVWEWKQLAGARTEEQ
ncbi:hypothetical protein MIS46_03180 [Wielerella bovis]|uniref:hypothetical protein n=1 Tax=Wielerella bovis TaxID=2917790 RepID=UPI0020196288|nr:hypothetical protein [Wielerella bovis]ULJ63071.1 hypothetical protein MIS46_03180 [Wielerella bovis]